MNTRLTRPVRRRRRLRGGFSLVEVLVAMTLLSVVLMSMAKMAFTIASAGRLNDVVAKRTMMLVTEANKFNSMPFDSLATVSTATKTFTFGDLKYTRRLTITTNSTTWKTVKIVITPFYYSSKKDSVFVT